MPRVWSRRDPQCPREAVYVGRPSKWGNPFTHLRLASSRLVRVATRADAVHHYRTWLLDLHPELVAAAREELKGRDLVCWCAPKACHADILLEIANA